MNAEQQTKQTKKPKQEGFKWGQELLKAKAIIASLNQTIGQLLAEKKEMQGQLDAYKAKYWFCEGECGKGFCFDEWDGHHEEEDITPFWCRECLKKAETLLYLTEEEMAEEEEDSEDDDFDYTDSCDCCVKGWSKANEFGRCVCRCDCGKLQRICRYKCSN